ncbi:MAG: PH domain-containing protein [Terricaulis sp.]|nr:PH domain-containing protein [Terricaulis sp.]
MSYVKSALAHDETIQAVARVHWILWVRAWLSLLILGWFLIGIYLFFRDVFFLVSTELALTNRRLIYKTGLLHRRTSDLVLNSIETVRISQDFWGQLFAYGRVQVFGTGSEVWTTPLISNPVRFRRAIAEASPSAHD